jgi:hypothetical protein
MTGFVSNRWARVVALAAPMSIVSPVFILHGFPWAGLGWVGLAFWTALAFNQPLRFAFPVAGPRK